jgi:predicted peroxiredoxin
MDAAKRKLVVIVTNGPNGDRSSVGFTVANAALSAGMEVAVFLASDGVDLAREGSADHSHAQPFLPLAELIAKFTAGGGTLMACSSCYSFRGLRQEWNVPQARVTGVAALTEWLAAGATTVTL